ncbi:type I pullulanase [Metabacillus halosaccharovorans]|uniref:type I pullulanase n=1 Tax=Metabacillus halosaccharovorans TaxID=930124 RepID=UPI0034CF3FD3
MKRSKLRALSLLVVLSFVLQLFSGFLPYESVSAEVTSPLINDDGTVTFLYEGKATSVKIAGSFTDWQNGAIDMTEESDGIWTLTKELTEGTYEYKFIVDDEWIMDPSNSKQANGNSVFTIGEPPELPAMKSPVINEDDMVTFNYESNGETAVYVIGSFNNWDLTTAVELTEKDGIFSTTILDLEPGEYQYKFIFNDRNWNENSTDPLNPNTTDGNSTFTIESLEPVMVQSALMDSLNEILVTTNKEIGKQEFVLTDNKTNEVIDTITTVIGNKKAQLTIADGESIDVRNVYEVSLGQSEGQKVTMRNVLNDDSFYYDGDDLGYTYSSSQTTFKLWAPTATKVNLAIYEDEGTYEGAFVKDHSGGSETDMKRENNGVWSVTINENLKNKYYMYKLEFADGTSHYALDPYARATSANGQRAAVVDLNSTDPKGFDPTDKPAIVSPADAIIYELHVRDFSIDEQSGMDNKGKYLAFTETGTTGPNGVKTGIDSLKELGVNYVHLLPTYDFGSVNELTVNDPNSTDAKFNWGYDPIHFNVPEGSYSTDPADPTSRIIEYKQMVQSLHDHGIRVISDVVYNHTYMNESTQLEGSSPFDLIVPGYYYRTDDTGKITNGSGTGNEVASERPMVRKYIKDSVHYWATEFGIDGFRFDLMGLIDQKTMQELTKELKNNVDPNMLIYGEPWTGGTTSLPNSMQHVKGSQKDQGYAVFNDNIRGAIKGDSDGAGTGFATGASGKEGDIVAGLKGAIDQFTSKPQESITYVTAHDNLNLWDKLMRVAGTDGNHESGQYDPHAVITEENALNNEWVKRSLLANGIVLTSQGIPFLHAGEEMLRSKYGVHNSYKSPDTINKIRWELKDEYQSVFNYYKGLIELRKKHAAFKMESTEKIEKHLQVFNQKDNIVAYQLKDNANNDTWKNIVVIYNANKTTKEVTLPTVGNWNIVVDHTSAGTETIRTVKSDKVSVEGLSMMVLYDQSEAEYTPVPTSIEINPDTFAINPGDTKGVTAYVKDQSGRVMLGEELIWSTSDNDVATVNNGRVVGVAEGVATIKVKAGDIVASIEVTVEKLAADTISIVGNNSVFETYSTQLSAHVKDQFNQDMLHAKVVWSSSDKSIATVDNTGKVTGIKPGNVVITATSGDADATFDIDVKKNVKRYVRIKYVRPDAEFTGDFGAWNLWVWNTGVKNDQIDFETIDGDTAVANVEIAPETESIGFLIRKGTDWNTAKISPDSDDHNVQINRDDIITKVTVVTGVPGQTVVPSVNGPVLEDGNVTFYYRDEELFQSDEMHSIEEVKVKIDGKEYPLEYSKENEYFSYKLEGLEEGTHAYTFLVTKDDETIEVTDPKNTKNGKSTITYTRPNLTIKTNVSPSEISFDENAVLKVEVTSEDKVNIREIYADFEALGGKEKVDIDPNVGAVSIAANQSVTAGEKEIKIVVIDEFGNTHKQSAKVTVKPEQSVGGKISFNWDEARIYFMLTDRFKDGDPSNNGKEEFDPAHSEAYHGGDFQGIINELDYIDDLGINTIWISPIVDNVEFNKGLDFKTAAGLEPKQYGYHGYWAKDFTTLDEHLGDMETFQELIEKAHDRGIKIMLDVVVNHAGYGMDGDIWDTWKADAKNLPTEDELAAFNGMLRTVDEDPTVRGELDNLPDFKTEDPAVRQKIINWQTEWLEKARTDRGDTIDYFRIDTVKHVEDATWQALKNELTAIDPSFKMIGEYWGASIANDGGYLGTGQMDSLLDFDFKEKAKAFVDGNIDSVESYLQDRNNKLTNSATLGQFLSSHDQNGFLTEYVHGDVGKLKVASALQITSKGQPVIYYGEELGRSGKSDWEKDADGNVLAFGQNRDDMPWDLYENGDSEAMALHKHYSTLLNIREDYSKVFSKGTREKIAGGDAEKYIVFKRQYDDENILVGLNTATEEKQATFPVDYAANTMLTDLYNDKEYVVNDKQEVTIKLPSKDNGGTAVLTYVTEKPGENPGEKPPGDNQEEEPVGDTGDDNSENPGNKPEDQSDEKSGNNPSDKPNDSSKGNTPVSSSKEGNYLPLTASSHYNWLIVGVIMILIGSVYVFAQRRKIER